MSGTGQFVTQNGQIIGPNGNVFVAKGIDIDAPYLERGDANAVLATFPGINFVRVAVYNYDSPAALQSAITTLTSHGVVVELSDYSNSTGQNSGGGVGSVFTGSALTNELNWYSSVASAFASNPYVWFGTDNEPPGPLAALSTWHQQTYDAVRNTGNNAPILIDEYGGGVPGDMGAGGGLTTSDYASMTNIVWDIHFYGWPSNYSTNQATVNSTLASMVSEAQTITSANGIVPVIIGEYGNATNGVTLDPNWSQVLTAVHNSGLGTGAWEWIPGSTGNVLLNSDGSLTAYGQIIAAHIAAGSPPTPPPPPTPVTPSPNDTVIKGTTGAITDASGNKWTITSGGQVAVNGTADTTTANVIELAYVNGAIWQENSSNIWWSKTSPGAAWGPASGTATSPLPVPSPNNTVVMAGSTGAITDTSGNQWTITAGGQVAVGGVADATTSNVIELAYENGLVWQENNSHLWWSKTSPGAVWGPTGGTATSPVPSVPTPPPPPPPTPAPSPNNTVVMAGATGAITDGSGNKWTITAGAQVAVNGVVDATTANVIELAYENKLVWQENSGHLWWSKASPSAVWGPTGGTATSPVPVAVVTSPNSTVVLAGSTNAITDASGNKWAITAGGQVAVNGVTDTTTANVIELDYTKGLVWQENTSNLWWSKTSPGATWGPTGGTATPPISITATNQATAAVTTIDATKVQSVTDYGATFVLTAPGVAKVTLGVTSDKLVFAAMSSISLTAGSAAATVVADGGKNTFTAGKGALDVKGGAGADSYVYHSGGALLTVEDFSATKGDSLTIDKTLQASLVTASDSHGGTLLTFGSLAAGIDLKAVTAVPTANIHWA